MDFAKAGLERFLTTLGDDELLADPVLLIPEEVDRYGSGVVGLEKLGLLVFQPPDLLVQRPPLGSRLSVHRLKLARQRRFNVRAEFWRQLHGLVVLDDHVFDSGDQDRLADAARPFSMATKADEIWIDTAVAVLGVSDDKSAAAAAADHRGLEIVRVLSLLLTGAPAVEHLLDPLPKRCIHDGLMSSWVAGASPDDQALVVGGAKDAVHLVGLDGSAGAFRRGSGGQPALLKLGRQTVDAPPSGRVGLIRPADERSTIGVDADGADLSAL